MTGISLSPVPTQATVRVPEVIKTTGLDYKTPMLMMLHSTWYCLMSLKHLHTDVFREFA